MKIMDEARIWCVGQAWWWRLLLLGCFVPLFVSLLKNPDVYNIFSPLNLCIHEIGHRIFGWGGLFVGIAGGTITQLAVPFIGMWNFYVQRDFFAIALCFGWLSTNFFNVSIYITDARSMQLHLVSPFGGDPLHDWNYMLSHTGLLAYDHTIAGLVWFLGFLSMLLCLMAGGWLLWQMAFLKK